MFSADVLTNQINFVHFFKMQMFVFCISSYVDFGVYRKDVNKVDPSLACIEPTSFILLDLFEAFDTIDHGIHLDCLTSWFGVSGTVLQ